MNFNSSINSDHEQHQSVSMRTTASFHSYATNHRLVFGDISSDPKTAIAKANTINGGKNGPFRAFIVVGKVFTKNNFEEVNGALQDGSVSVDLPMFFTDGEGLPEDSATNQTDVVDIAPNVTFLNQWGRLMTDDFIIQNATSGSNDRKTAPTDILITDKWPSNLPRLSKVGFAVPQTAERATNNDKTIDATSKDASPLYHFSGSESFWEREPFANEAGKHTRFIGLAPFGGKQRWHYAFTLKKDDTSTPVNATECPYLKEDKVEEEPLKRANEDDGDPMAKKPRIAPSDCFLCLSNPNLAAHLVVSIGQESYMAMAKGPLLPGHVMLIPIKHNPDFCTESRPSTNPRHRHPVRFVSPKLALELRKYQIALKQMHPGGVVFYEIAKAKGVHVHQQAVPIPQEKINNVENLREFFIKEAKECGFRMENNGELRDDQTNYFRIEFPNSDPIVIKLNRQNPKFDVTWPRKLLAQWFFGNKERGDWRNCSQTEAEETEAADKIKGDFETFDFTR